MAAPFVLTRPLSVGQAAVEEAEALEAAVATIREAVDMEGVVEAMVGFPSYPHAMLISNHGRRRWRRELRRIRWRR